MSIPRAHLKNTSSAINLSANIQFMNSDIVLICIVDTTHILNFKNKHLWQRGLMDISIQSNWTRLCLSMYISTQIGILSEGMSYTCLFRQSILFAKNCSIQVFLTFLFALQRKKKQYILSNVNSHLNFKGARSFACGVVYWKTYKLFSEFHIWKGSFKSASEKNSKATSQPIVSYKKTA